eukprot:NODE_1898_length_717_cov_77.938623_g1479_i0.p1 GENE.NODE_1898_length_717_cov_77.938623_g1479_i0~~NODE_1898_length_717_cov_77.938623_g1479_i0.p1  ORF type:complete len:217 (-),score=72.13 NODE_1898_length_717_cov_77.938623_g1479_i0:67-669(-)
MANKTYVYKDMTTGCEMFNIANPHSLMPDNDAILVVQSALIRENGDAIDTGCGNAFGEDAEAEPLDDGEVVVNNIISTAGLIEAGGFEKKRAILEWAKPYLGRVKERLATERPDRVDGFMTGAQAFIKKLCTELDEYVVYVNSAMDYEGALIFARFDEGATVPRFFFFRDGLGLFYPGSGTGVTAGRVPDVVAKREGCIV